MKYQVFNNAELFVREEQYGGLGVELRVNQNVIRWGVLRVQFRLAKIFLGFLLHFGF